jgi:allantoinase
MKAIISDRILIGNEIKAACLLIENEKIIGIENSLPKNYQGEVFDFTGQVVMPGIVDTHVHINEPGRTEWEGFNTATKAAAAGGITTVVDMPLNCIPATTTKLAFKEKLDSVKDKLWVDVGFWGGAVPDELDNLAELLGSGVLGVKSFLIESGVDEFKFMTHADLEVAMPIIARSNLPYLIHAEIDDGHTNEVTKYYQSFVDSRPRSWENSAIDKMIELTKIYKTKTHMVHLASSDAIEKIKIAKSEGLEMTVETCPHYLTLSSETIPDGKTIFKCCPPIREEENRLNLWQGLKDGVIDFIVSDHSPCTPNLKLIETQDLDKAWGGISSLQFSLPLVWSEAKDQGLSLSDLSNLMSKKTAQFVNLANKGEIKIGNDADLVIWNPEEKFTITKDLIQHKHKVTPYEGREVYGVVKATLLRGKFVFNKNQFEGPFGATILRGKK